MHPSPMQSRDGGLRGEALRARVAYWSAVSFCFAVLAVLNGRGIDPRAGFVSAYAVCMLAFALLALGGLGVLILSLNGAMRRSLAYPQTLDVLARGYVALIHFTLLALLAELGLGWNAAQVFTQAGIMTCGAMAGAEIVSMSGGRTVHVITPVAGSFLFAFLWLLLSAMAQAAVR